MQTTTIINKNTSLTIARYETPGLKPDMQLSFTTYLGKLDIGVKPEVFNKYQTDSGQQEIYLQIYFRYKDYEVLKGWYGVTTWFYLPLNSTTEEIKTAILTMFCEATLNPCHCDFLDMPKIKHSRYQYFQ